jgi:hypothetical protein
MMQVGALTHKLGTGVQVPLITENGYLFSNTSEIIAFKSHYGEAHCMIGDQVFTAAKSYSQMVHLIQPLPGWFHTASGLRVNLHHIAAVRPESPTEYTLIAHNGLEFPLNPKYYEDVRKYYAAKTLQHVTPLSLPQYWMMKLGIREIEKDIRYMNKKELYENFSTEDGNTIVVSDLISNFLYQQVQFIRKSGEGSPIAGGNVRSLWYLIKPTLSRLGLIDGTNHYKTLSERLAEMVEHKILLYSEFELYEDGKWNIGLYNPHIIFLAEKDSHFNFLQEIQDYSGVTIFASGGQPSMMTCEYFTTAFKEKVPEYWLKDRVAIVNLMDYDPHGYLILDTFIDNLRVFGIKHPTEIKLSIPENYSPEDLEFQHINLVKEDEVPGTILRKWMKKTNGINGEKWGMEVDVMMLNKPKVKQLFLAAADPWFKVQPPVERRIWEEIMRLEVRI